MANIGRVRVILWPKNDTRLPEKKALTGQNMVSSSPYPCKGKLDGGIDSYLIKQTMSDGLVGQLPAGVKLGVEDADRIPIAKLPLWQSISNIDQINIPKRFDLCGAKLPKNKLKNN
jgi:hypothetical protein